MKFIAVIGLILILVITWRGYKGTSDVSSLTHYNLQTELKSFITNYIQTHLKGVSNITFQKFFTEPTNTAEVRAVFEYSFDSDSGEGDTARTLLTGYAYLTPQGDQKNWSLDRIEIADQVIDFKNGTLLGPSQAQ